jgi:hypothetical protein
VVVCCTVYGLMGYTASGITVHLSHSCQFLVTELELLDGCNFM